MFRAMTLFLQSLRPIFSSIIGYFLFLPCVSIVGKLSNLATSGFVKDDCLALFKSFKCVYNKVSLNGLRLILRSLSQRLTLYCSTANKFPLLNIGLSLKRTIYYTTLAHNNHNILATYVINF